MGARLRRGIQILPCKILLLNIHFFRFLCDAAIYFGTVTSISIELCWVVFVCELGHVYIYRNNKEEQLCFWTAL
jgi:hypothetical protein